MSIGKPLCHVIIHFILFLPPSFSFLHASCEMLAASSYFSSSARCPLFFHRVPPSDVIPLCTFWCVCEREAGMMRLGDGWAFVPQLFHLEYIYTWVSGYIVG